MAKVTFDLINNNILDDIVKSFDTLRDCVAYIRLHIDNARNFTVDELEDSEIVNSISVYYLLEKYKNLDDLPLSTFDC